jgi:NMT1-like family
VAVPALGSHQHLLVASIVAYVSLDPRTDIYWPIHRGPDAMQLLAEDRIDGLMGYPPEPQELRAKQIGHGVVNSTLDRPWSQYFCCMVAANPDFVRAHPVASKRALRALLKATDLCALEPTRAEQLVVERGYTPRYDYALIPLDDEDVLLLQLRLQPFFESRQGLSRSWRVGPEHAIDDNGITLGDACHRPKAFVGLGKKGEATELIEELLLQSLKGHRHFW